MKTPLLLRNEIRMLYNQFKQTLKMPGTLLFYIITFSGVIFVGLVVTSFMQFSPLVSNIAVLIRDTIDRGGILLALGAITASSVFGGYFGIGPASVLSESDENILMPAPVKPYQVFLALS